MSYVLATPEMVAAAANNLAQIGSTLSAANAAGRDRPDRGPQCPARIHRIDGAVCRRHGIEPAPRRDTRQRGTRRDSGGPPRT